MATVIVDSWDGFLNYVSGSDTIKFANPHVQEGEIVLEGNGTQSNPYIVSTVEELLFATQAPSIYYVKLIENEPEQYYYNGIYCLYDRTPTTINFNIIRPEGYSNYNQAPAVTPYVDFNGWTLENMRFLNYGRFVLNGGVTNVNFLNVIDENDITNTGIISCGAQATNIRLSCLYECTQNYGIFGVRSGSNSSYRGLISGSFDVVTTQRRVIVLCDSGNSYTPKCDSVSLNVKMSTDSTSAVSIKTSGIQLFNSIITGEITAPNCPNTYIDVNPLLDAASKNNIVDIKANVEEGHNNPTLRFANGSGLFNIVTNDRGVNYYFDSNPSARSVPYSTLFDSEALYNLGLPIFPN